MLYCVAVAPSLFIFSGEGGEGEREGERKECPDNPPTYIVIHLLYRHIISITKDNSSGDVISVWASSGVSPLALCPLAHHTHIIGKGWTAFGRKPFTSL